MASWPCSKPSPILCGATRRTSNMFTRNVHGTPEARPKQLTTCRVWTAFKRQFDHVGASPGTCTPPESGTRRIRICPPHTKLRCLVRCFQTQRRHGRNVFWAHAGHACHHHFDQPRFLATLCLRELHPLGSPLGKATCFHTNRLRP